jgi:hypothetical protein
MEESQMSEVRGLVELLEDFIGRNTVQGDIGVALDVSDEEYKALSDFLFKGMIVWMLGIERARWSSRRPILVEVTPPPDQLDLDPELPDKNKNVIIWRAL